MSGPALRTASRPILVPAKYFSAYAKASTTDCDSKKCAPPQSRFEKRNTFMRRRHLERDHIIRAHHYDVRISAIRLTETLREAVQRHGMIAEEARQWGSQAACSALYASFLRGDERLKIESATMITYPEPDTTEELDMNTLDNQTYVECFAVGEIRGYSHFNQYRLAKHLTLWPRNPKDSEIMKMKVGDGIFRVSRILYGYEKPYVTKVDAFGDAVKDWKNFYATSEQIPTHLQVVAKVKDTPLDNILGFDGPPTITEMPALDDRVSYLNIPVDDVQFVGAVIIQVLAGAAKPEIRDEILAQRAELQKSMSVEERQNVLLETDDEYVKRIQLERLHARMKELDLQGIMTKYGVAAYVAALLGEDPESLTYRGIAEGNINNEIDFEALDRQLIESTLRKSETESESDPKAIKDTTTATSTATATEASKSPSYPIKYSFQYKPIAFFCRCYQTKTEEKLGQLPLPLLQDLHSDGGAEFTCDFCNAKQEVTAQQLQQAIDVKQQAKK